jgi:molybdenum transport protein
MWTLPVTEIERLIAEDVPAGDLTTETLAITDRPARMIFSARGLMTVAGIEVAAQIVRACGAEVLSHLTSGTRRVSAHPAGDVVVPGLRVR